MPKSPEGYKPYKRPNFPPKLLDPLAKGLAALFVLVSVMYYQPDSLVAFIVGLLFGVSANLYIHESIHFISLRKLGYDPEFYWPNHVWAPNAALSVRESVITLITPQLLTVVYIALIALSEVTAIDFMLVIALIFNLAGGLRDVAWATRRLLWPKGHLVLVDLEGREWVTFPK